MTASAAASAAIEPTEPPATETAQAVSSEGESDTVLLQIGDVTLSATLAQNSSVDALLTALAEGPITIDMHDYGSMEKVGTLGIDLPRNDEPITTEAGDLILYLGNRFVIYYAPNSWDFTRLGKLNDVSAQELRALLGTGNVTITLSLP